MCRIPAESGQMQSVQCQRDGGPASSGNCEEIMSRVCTARHIHWAPSKTASQPRGVRCWYLDECLLLGSEVKKLE